MKTLTNLKFSLVLLLFCSVSFFFIGQSCVGATEDPVETDDNITVKGYATDKITHTHIKGTDPCPQPIASKIEVYCYKGEDFSSCDADSVVITSTVATTGLTAAFSNGQQSIALNSNGTAELITLAFTCDVAVSFKHQYTLVFYKNGVQVDSEVVEVDVTVK